MGCEISYQKPIEAEVKLVISGRQVEVTKLVTTAEDHCNDGNCTICFDSQESSLSGSFDDPFGEFTITVFLLPLRLL